MAAFLQALDEHAAEGGVAGRGARYAHNHKVLVDGMENLGFACLLPRALQAPIIVTFHMPADPKFDFGNFYTRLSDKGFLIYPGKTEMHGALDAISAVLEDMGVHDRAPATTS